MTLIDHTEINAHTEELRTLSKLDYANDLNSLTRSPFHVNHQQTTNIISSLVSTSNSSDKHIIYPPVASSSYMNPPDYDNPCSEDAFCINQKLEHGNLVISGSPQVSPDPVQSLTDIPNEDSHVSIHDNINDNEPHSDSMHIDTTYPNKSSAVNHDPVNLTLIESVSSPEDKNKLSNNSQYQSESPLSSSDNQLEEEDSKSVNDISTTAKETAVEDHCSTSFSPDLPQSSSHVVTKQDPYIEKSDTITDIENSPSDELSKSFVDTSAIPIKNDRYIGQATKESVKPEKSTKATKRHRPVDHFSRELCCLYEDLIDIGGSLYMDESGKSQRRCRLVKQNKQLKSSQDNNISPNESLSSRVSQSKIQDDDERVDGRKKAPGKSGRLHVSQDMSTIKQGRRGRGRRRGSQSNREKFSRKKYSNEMPDSVQTESGMSEAGDLVGYTEEDMSPNESLSQKSNFSDDARKARKSLTSIIDEGTTSVRHDRSMTDLLYLASEKLNADHQQQSKQCKNVASYYENLNQSGESRQKLTNRMTDDHLGSYPSSSLRLNASECNMYTYQVSDNTCEFSTDPENSSNTVHQDHEGSHSSTLNESLSQISRSTWSNNKDENLHEGSEKILISSLKNFMLENQEKPVNIGLSNYIPTDSTCVEQSYSSDHTPDQSSPAFTLLIDNKDEDEDDEETNEEQSEEIGFEGDSSNDISSAKNFFRDKWDVETPSDSSCKHDEVKNLSYLKPDNQAEENPNITCNTPIPDNIIENYDKLIEKRFLELLTLF